jgi:hypothetical protein
MQLRSSWLDTLTKYAISQKGAQSTCLRRNTNPVLGQASHRWRVQVAAGGVSGVAAVVITVGIAIARLTTTSKYSAEAVVVGVTIVGAFIGGFLVAPYLNGEGGQRRSKGSG